MVLLLMVLVILPVVVPVEKNRVPKAAVVFEPLRVQY